MLIGASWINRQRKAFFKRVGPFEWLGASYPYPTVRTHTIILELRIPFDRSGREPIIFVGWPVRVTLNVVAIATPGTPASPGPFRTGEHVIQKAGV